MNMLYISLLNGFGIFTIFLYTFNFAIEIMYTLMFEILISYLQIVSETNHNGPNILCSISDVQIEFRFQHHCVKSMYSYVPPNPNTTTDNLIDCIK